MNRSIVKSNIFKNPISRSKQVCLLLTAFVSFALFIPATANSKPLTISIDQPDKSSVQFLLDELDDIDFMRSLSPLKLTGEQIDKLIIAISDAKTTYDKKIADLSASSVGAMAEEIHKRHKEAVAGGPASDAFDTKVKRMMTDFFAKRDTINADNIIAMTSACGMILTSDQKKIATQMEKDTLVKMNKKPDPSNTDAKYFNAYVVDIFIGYRRIIPLLKDMKAAA